MVGAAGLHIETGPGVFGLGFAVWVWFLAPLFKAKKPFGACTPRETQNTAPAAPFNPGAGPILAYCGTKKRRF